MSGWLLGLTVAITVLSIPGTWVQFVHIVRKRTAAGLSVSTNVFWMWSSCIWGYYGVVENNPGLILTNVSSMIGCALIVLGAAHFNGVPILRWVVATGAFLAFAATLEMTVGFAGINAVAAVMVVGSRMPQMYRSWKEPGGAGVNLFNFGSAGATSILWVTYGVLIADWFLVATSVYCVAFAALIIGQTVRGRREAGDRFARELEAALLYERHRTEQRRFERPIDITEVVTN